MTAAIIPQTEATPANASNATVLGIYHVAPGTPKMDIIDQLQARLAHLSAMLCTTYGAGFQTFDNWSETIKEDYLWSCAMLVNECRDLSKHI